MLRNWTDYVLFENFFKKTRNQEELGPLGTQGFTCILRTISGIHVTRKNLTPRGAGGYVHFWNFS